MFKPYFNCSEAAALIGDNPWRNRNSAILLCMFKEAKRPSTRLPKAIREALLNDESVQYAVQKLGRDDTLAQHVPAFDVHEDLQERVEEQAAAAIEAAQAARVAEAAAASEAAAKIAEARAAAEAARLTLEAHQQAAAAAFAAAVALAKATQNAEAVSDASEQRKLELGVATQKSEASQALLVDAAKHHKATALSATNSALKAAEAQSLVSKATADRAATAATARVLAEAAAAGPRALRAHSEAQATKKRGREGEDQDLNALAKRRSVAVTERNTSMKYKSFKEYTLGGRCDGVMDNGTIVESKRRKRFWANVPEYDIIQLRAYLEIYGATDGVLSENFPDGSNRETFVKADAEEWATIHEGLCEAAEAMRALQTKEDLMVLVDRCAVE